MENLETSAHVWASTSVGLVLIKSALHQRFGCWSGLHLNLTEFMEILGEILKEFDLSQMFFFFLVDPILQNTDKQSQLFGQAPGKSHSDPLKTNFF